MNYIDGGVCAPMGFTANAVLAGIKKSRTKDDLALIESEVPCQAAAVFTTNIVKAEPVKLSMKHIGNGKAQAIVANAGNANACTGESGYQAALRTARSAAEHLGIAPQDVLVCSTGVIGQQINIAAIEGAMESLCEGLSRDGHVKAREAIMTTDTVYKEVACEVEIHGKKVRLGTMAKGSGMIHINMGTMLGFITTDCAISARLLKAALKESAERTYNCVSVDGDTSTNDTLIILANGLAGNKPIRFKGRAYRAFVAALDELNTQMAKKIAADGEGATRLIECAVSGASSVMVARSLAKTVISSSLVKAAFFGKDANWGRILCAMGYSGNQFTQATTNVSFSSGAGSIEVFHQGVPLDFDEGLAKEILGAKEVTIHVALADGKASAKAWGCDLTYDYVKINGDYRT